MTTNLLNPACDDCYECCAPCGDYYSPNEWYALFCNMKTANTGYVNRILQPDGYYYFWENNTLGDDLNGLMLNWDFTEPGSELVITGDEYKFRSRQLVDISLNQTLNVFRHTNYSAIESAYDPFPFVFKPHFYIWITDTCGVRTARAIINGVQTITSIGNPQGDIAKPTTAAPMWAVETDPAVACGETMEGNILTPGEFEDVERTPRFKPPHLIESILPGDVSLKVQSNDSMLTC